MRHRHIRSCGLRPAVPTRESGLITALRSLRADPRTCIVNPFILAELARLGFIRQTPWASAVTLKGEAFLNDLAAHSPQRSCGFYRQANLRT